MNRQIIQFIALSIFLSVFGDLAFGFTVIPKDAQVSTRPMRWGDANRGLLPVMSEERRFTKEATNVGRSAYDEAYGKPNFGLGKLPDSDGFKTAWWRMPSSERVPFRRALREWVFGKIKRQTAGLDPRFVPLSLKNFVFHQNTREWHTFKNGRTTHRVLEVQFLIESPLFEAKIPGRVLVPESVLNSGKAAPAVLYQHYHGEGYGVGSSEIFWDWHLIGEGKPAQVLTKLGFVVVSTDYQGFRRRRVYDDFRDNKPGSRRLVKAADQFHGRQYGANPQWIGDHQDKIEDARKLAVLGSSRYAVRSFEDYLVFRLAGLLPYVDSTRIFSMGMSMGGVRTWTLAALAGPKLRGAVANGTFPRFYRTIKDGPHNHADLQSLAGQFEMSLPKLGISYLDTEHYLFLALETNLIIQMGEQDPSSPGWREMFDMSAEVSRGELTTFRQERSSGGHTFTSQNLINAYSFFYEEAFGKPLKDDPELRLWGTF